MVLGKENCWWGKALCSMKNSSLTIANQWVFIISIQSRQVAEPSVGK